MRLRVHGFGIQKHIVYIKSHSLHERKNGHLSKKNGHLSHSIVSACTWFWFTEAFDLHQITWGGEWAPEVCISVKRDLVYRQKRPSIWAKETY